MNGDVDLSRELTQIVATTAGVVDVFPSGSPLQSASLSIVNLATFSDLGDAKVAVSRVNNVLTLRATIGVSASYPVQVTVRTVSDAIRNHLFLTGMNPSPEIEVKVSYIEWRPEPDDVPAPVPMRSMG